MGTHPIFESDFDCLTENKNDDEPIGTPSELDGCSDASLVWSNYQGGCLCLVEGVLFHRPNHGHPRLLCHGGSPSPLSCARQPIRRHGSMSSMIRCRGSRLARRRPSSTTITIRSPKRAISMGTMPAVWSPIKITIKCITHLEDNLFITPSVGTTIGLSLYLPK